MAKPPSLPSQWLIENIQGEPAGVIAGFMNIVLFWIERGNIQIPSETKFPIISRLPKNLYDKSEKRIKELLNQFYEPFIFHWSRGKQTQAVLRANANTANAAYSTKKRAEKKNKLQDKNVKHELSSLPHKDSVSETKWENNGKFDPQLRRKMIAKAKVRTDFKPGLRDA